MSRRGGGDLDCKLYVGDLPRDVEEKELEKPFSYYGPLKSVWVARNPPGFAFVEFEDPRDADDAVRGLDGTTICGGRARVEHSTGKIRPKPWVRGGRDMGRRDGGGGGGGGYGSRSRRFDPSDRCYQCGETGHYAYDCRRSGGGGSSGRSRSSRRRSRSRSRSYTRSRSRSRGRRSRTRSYTRSRSRTPQRD